MYFALASVKLVIFLDFRYLELNLQCLEVEVEVEYGE